MSNDLENQLERKATHSSLHISFNLSTKDIGPMQALQALQPTWTSKPRCSQTVWRSWEVWLGRLDRIPGNLSFEVANEIFDKVYAHSTRLASNPYYENTVKRVVPKRS